MRNSNSSILNSRSFRNNTYQRNFSESNYLNIDTLYPEFSYNQQSNQRILSKRNSVEAFDPICEDLNLIGRNKAQRRNDQENKLFKFNFRRPENTSIEFAQSFIFFTKAEILLIKLFMNEEILPQDLELKEFEVTIIKRILLKKKFQWANHMKFDVDTLNRVRNCFLKKKNEDELKFILKKCIKHLQNRFFKEIKISNLNKNLKDNKTPQVEIKKDKDNVFYEYFFSNIAKKESIPIERFFHFRSWKKRFSNEIPKSITRESLALWKKNPVFIKTLIDYIQFDFLDAFRLFNIKKIRTMVSKWDKLIDEFGQTKGLQEILRSFEVRGSKLPWTLTEVTFGIKNTLKSLN